MAVFTGWLVVGWFGYFSIIGWWLGGLKPPEISQLPTGIVSLLPEGVGKKSRYKKHHHQNEAKALDHRLFTP